MKYLLDLGRLSLAIWTHYSNVEYLRLDNSNDNEFGQLLYVVSLKHENLLKVLVYSNIIAEVVIVQCY